MKDSDSSERTEESSTSDDIMNEAVKKAAPGIFGELNGIEAGHLEFLPPLPVVEFDILPDLAIKDIANTTIHHFMLESQFNDRLVPYCMSLGAQYGMQYNFILPLNYIYYLGEENYQWTTKMEGGSSIARVSLIEVYLKPIPDDLPDVAKKFAELLYKNKGLKEVELLLKMRELFYSDPVFEDFTIIDDFEFVKNFDEVIRYRKRNK